MGSRIAASFRVQARDFVEMRQWKSPRNGYVAKISHTPWKTYSKCASEKEAEQRMMHYFKQAGLRQVRVMHGKEIVMEVM